MWHDKRFLVLFARKRASIHRWPARSIKKESVNVRKLQGKKERTTPLYPALQQDPSHHTANNLLEICPRGNNKVVIIYLCVYDKASYP